MSGDCKGWGVRRKRRAGRYGFACRLIPFGEACGPASRPYPLRAVRPCALRLPRALRSLHPEGSTLPCCLPPATSPDRTARPIAAAQTGDV